MLACSLSLRRSLLLPSAKHLSPRTLRTIIQSPQFLPPSSSRVQTHRTFIRPASVLPSLPVGASRNASVSAWAIALTVLALCGGTTWLRYNSDSTEEEIPVNPPASRPEHDPFLGILDTLKTMPVEISPGHVGNLSLEQEAKLQELWILTLKVFGVNVDMLERARSKASSKESAPQEKKKAKRGFGFFGGGGKETATETTKDNNSSDPLASTLATLSIADGDDKYGLSKQFQKALTDMTPEQIRTTFWTMVKLNNPDSLLLRFLRARKWDVKKALVMFVSTIHWRLADMHIDDDIMLNGEAFALKQSESSNPKDQKFGKEFMFQLRQGKNYFRGVDKFGRPIVVISVRKHRAGDQSVAVMERYTAFTIEVARLMLVPPVETATIIFDMTNFGLANMDYAPVKFMIRCFEANYPESLGAVLIHKAPWVFSGIWNIIKGWLDPVVASKIHFTNTAKDLEEYIPHDRIMKELDGEDEWKYEYIEPHPEENKKMEDTTTRDTLVAKRGELSKQVEQATIAWIQATKSGDKDAKAAATEKRDDVINKLTTLYWDLDPYIRARSIYDRFGIINPGGKINYYPDKGAETPATNGASSVNGTKTATTEEEVPIKDETAP